jgi:ABC-2 type transport system permease protein
MTAAAPPVLPGSTRPPSRTAPAAVRARDVLASEWIKLWSVRSTYAALVIAAVLAVGLSALGTYLTATAAAHPPHGSPPPPDALTLSFSGFPTAQLALAVLGVLAFTAEQSTGLLRTTFVAVPRRRAVLAAKAATAGAVALAAGEVLAFASFFLTQAILSGHHRGLSLAHPGVAGAVLAGGFYLAVVALLGLGLGVLLRSAAAAIAAAVALTYLIPEILSLLPSPWNGRIDRFLPLTAAQQLVSLHPRTDMFAPALSLLVVIGWAAAALAAACVVITRRDA